MADFLYIHIPFCIRKCLYCDFTSIPYDASLVDRYGTALCRELALKRHLAGELKALYIGGGTPSLMPDAFFGQLFSCLRKDFSFSPSAEVTVEANPGTIERTKVERLAALGVNRFSVGVQSFDDRELKTLGRIHTSGEAERSLAMVKEAGIRNISLDLMYGIPGQTMETWMSTLRKATDSSPCHISSYELTPEAETPLTRLLAQKTLTLPDEELVLEMYDAAISHFSSLGYAHYEISNFALPGFECRHNMNYWDRGEYIGAGAGAHSFIEGVRSDNTKQVDLYVMRIVEGLSAAGESLAVTPSEEIREYIFLGLRKIDGLSMAHLTGSGIDIAKEAGDLIDQGYLEIKGDSLRLTRKGIVLSNTIIVRLFEKLHL